MKESVRSVRVCELRKSFFSRIIVITIMRQLYKIENNFFLLILLLLLLQLEAAAA